MVCALWSTVWGCGLEVLGFRGDFEGSLVSVIVERNTLVGREYTRERIHSGENTLGREYTRERIHSGRNTLAGS